MTDLKFDALVVPTIAEVRLSAPSTPLQREAGRLQDVLPPGWLVDVVDGAQAPGAPFEPVLRVRMPEN
ncbi:hypothetical protein [Nocardia mexicana]|uniref:Uncharacterized protein n=1 Tax=Nocardia mexicana TaxID=279262 RepID=A0A370GSV3_9NOCA|nr:hypothetical protein [Nocardia mexicana]RDI46782.1 hypothetical protein DFR68_110188 [Nocardia mexicana]